MLDIGMTELLVIGIVALIVVGPKDLPMMFRTLGRFVGKMRGMARDFQRAMEDAADESGMRDIQKDLKGLSNPKKYGLDKLNEAAGGLKEWDPAKSAKARPKGPETEAMASDRRAKADAAKSGRASGGANAPARAPAEADQVEPAAPAKPAGTSADTPLTKEPEE